MSFGEEFCWQATVALVLVSGSSTSSRRSPITDFHSIEMTGTVGLQADRNGYRIGDRPRPARPSWNSGARAARAIFRWLQYVIFRGRPLEDAPARRLSKADDDLVSALSRGLRPEAPGRFLSLLSGTNTLRFPLNTN